MAISLALKTLLPLKTQYLNNTMRKSLSELLLSKFNRNLFNRSIDSNAKLIKRINIISPNMNNCKVFRYEFEKIVQETKTPDLYKERNQKF